MMERWICRLLAAVVALMMVLSPLAAQAQMPYAGDLGRAERGMLEADWNYRMGVLSLQRQQQLNATIDRMLAEHKAQKAEYERRVAQGKQIIAAGKATTVWKPGSPETSEAIAHFAKTGSKPGQQAVFKAWLRKAYAAYPQVVRAVNASSKTDFQVNDVADAAAMCSLASYAALTGNDKATPKQILAVRNKARRNLLQNAVVQSYGQPGLRAIGEMYVLFTLYLGGIQSETVKLTGAPKTQTQQALATEAAAAFRFCTGSTVAQISLTDAGFVPKQPR